MRISSGRVVVFGRILLGGRERLPVLAVLVVIVDTDDAATIGIAVELGE